MGLGLPPPTAGRRTLESSEEEKKRIEAGGAAEERKINPGELRMKKELLEIDIPRFATVFFPDPKDVMNFDVTISLKDEPDSLWTGAKYKFAVTVPAGYPHDPPKCKCLDKIWHPNIDLDGNVCLNILRSDWKPVLEINSVILGLIFLFIDPNPNDPLNRDAAEQMVKDKKLFATTVRNSINGGIVNGIRFPKNHA